MGKTTLENKKSFNYQKSEEEADQIAEKFSGASDVKKSMESRFGVDFSGVKLHTDTGAAKKADAMGAAAFAKGSDIYFGEGVYDQGSSLGRHAIAHELAHTMQQGTAGGGEGAISAPAPVGAVQMLDGLTGKFRRFGRKKIGKDLVEGMRGKAKNGSYSNKELKMIEKGTTPQETALFSTGSRRKSDGFDPMIETTKSVAAPYVGSGYARMKASMMQGTPEEVAHRRELFGGKGGQFHVIGTEEGVGLQKEWQSNLVQMMEDTIHDPGYADVSGGQADAFDSIKGTELGEAYSNPYLRSVYSLNNLSLKGVSAGVMTNVASDEDRSLMTSMSSVGQANLNMVLNELGGVALNAGKNSLTRDSISPETMQAILDKVNGAQRHRLENGLAKGGLDDDETELTTGIDSATPEFVMKMYNMMVDLGDQMKSPVAAPKQGFFSKLFGRKKKAPAAAATPTAAMAPAAPAAAIAPAAAPVPAAAIAPAAAPGAWANARGKGQRAHVKGLFGTRGAAATAAHVPDYSGYAFGGRNRKMDGFEHTGSRRVVGATPSVGNGNSIQNLLSMHTVLSGQGKFEEADNVMQQIRVLMGNGQH